MPITQSAKKALRGSRRKRVFNNRRRLAFRKSIKNINKDNLSLAYKAIDKAAKRGVIKKNTAARKKSRLARLINKSARRSP